jgi:hypothetical protein
MSCSNKVEFYPGECSVDICIGCTEFMCDGMSKNNTINDGNCICFPIICGIGIVFDIITCVPYSFYTSYKKCKPYCCKGVNKVAIAVIKQPKIQDLGLPSYQFAIRDVNDTYNQNIVHIIIDSPPSYY